MKIKRIFSFILALVLCSSSVCFGAGTDKRSLFTDVSAEDWYYDGVCYSSSAGIFNGIGNNQFQPDGLMTRAMVVTCLWRHAGSPNVSGGHFSDVPKNQWFSVPVAWASKNGIVNGISKTLFDPNSPMTREQFAAVLYRYGGQIDVDLSGRANINGYSDCSAVAGYAGAPMQWAIYAGLMNGAESYTGETLLNPQGNISRAYAASVFMRFDKFAKTGLPCEPGYELPIPKPESKGLIVIDAGHQRYANTELEPIGPGASEKKMKVSGGTVGRYTGIPEYELTLQLALMLKDELESRSYEVIMVRETNDVNISNAERAEIANEANADAFIRIHGNGIDNSSTNGVMTICQTPKNIYNGSMYKESHLLSEKVLDEVVSATGANKMYVWETDTMSGVNWSQVPCTIVEVGFMTNPTEDKLMATDEYRQKITLGLANGIDAFFES